MILRNIKDIAQLRGSEELWELAKLHNRESSFPEVINNPDLTTIVDFYIHQLLHLCGIIWLHTCSVFKYRETCPQDCAIKGVLLSLEKKRLDMAIHMFCSSLPPAFGFTLHSIAATARDV